MAELLATRSADASSFTQGETIHHLSRRKIKRITRRVAALAQEDSSRREPSVLPIRHNTFIENDRSRLTIAQWSNDSGLSFQVSFRDKPTFWGRKLLDAKLQVAVRTADSRSSAELQLSREAKNAKLVTHSNPGMTREIFSAAQSTLRRASRRRAHR